MNMSLRQLRYVVAAADCGHVTAAAKRLNVSQPSVSSAIAEVEAEIGVPLFIRHHARGVTLTPARGKGRQRGAASPEARAGLRTERASNWATR